MKNLRMLTVAVLGLFVANCASAGTQTAQQARLVLRALDHDQTLVDGNEAVGSFILKFSVTAERGKVCFSRSVSRGIEFVVLIGGGDDIFEEDVAVTNIVFKTEDSSKHDSSLEFCITRGRTRNFRLSLNLEYPERDGFFSVQLGHLGGERTTNVFLPSKTDFRTDTILIESEDIDN